MSDKIIYTLNNGGSSIIGKEFLNMEEWLNSLSNKALYYFYEICNKNSEERSDKDNYEIYKHSIVLYCRELGIDELSINTNLLFGLSKNFCKNIIFESLRRNGMVKTNQPILLYKGIDIEITEKGNVFFKKRKKIII